MLQHLLRILTLFLFVLSFAMSSTARAQDITSNLISHWTFDNDSGSTINDASGNTNNGTWTDGVNNDIAEEIVTGRNGNALRFSADTVVNAAIFPTGSNAPYSVSMWIKFNSLGSPGQNALWTAGPVSPTCQNGPKLRKIFEVSNYRISADNQCGGSSETLDYVYDDIWYHLTTTYDGANVSIYLNGKLSERSASSYNGTHAQAAQFRLGDNGLSTGILADIDDVRVYGRALTEADIARLYTSHDVCNEDHAGKMIYNTDYRVMQYCDGSDWIDMGKDASVLHGQKTIGDDAGLNAVNFNGADHLTGTYNGPSNPTTFSGSVWFYRNALSGANTDEILYIGDTSDGRLRIRFSFTNDTIAIEGANSAATLQNLAQTTTQFQPNRWYHVLFSIDSTDNSRGGVWVNDAAAPEGRSGNTLTEIGLDNGTDPLFIGQNEFGNGIIDSNLGELWIDFGTFIDFSVEANRRLFIDADGKAIFLGNDGSLPTGSAPDIFLSGATDDWHTNKGSNAGFVENGTLTDSVSRLPQDTPRQLIGWWKMDEMGGTTAADSSGNGYNGTMIGGITGSNSVSGPVNTALTFDGTDDYIDANFNTDFPNGGYTMSAWIKTTDTGNQRIINKSITGTDQKWLSLKNDGTVECGLYDTASGRARNVAYDVRDGKWHHLACTVSADTMTIYINGAPAGTTLTHNGSLITNAGSWQIGRNPGGFAYFDGALDDVRLYNYALSPEEMEELYYASSDFYQPNAVEFDGTADMLEGPVTPIGMTDSKEGTVSVWFKLDDVSSDRRILRNSSSRIIVEYDNNNGGQIRIWGEDSANNTLINMGTTSFNGDTTGWHHVMASWDTSDPAKRHIYLDGVSDLNTVDYITHIDGNINYSPGYYRVGANAIGDQMFDGYLADLWFDNNYIDLSVEANRRRFIDEDGNAKYLGPNGEFAGAVPKIFLSGDTATWHNNLGTNGGFTENGAITDAPTTPFGAKMPRYCSNPTQPEGTLIYNSNDNVMQYCDAYRWIPLGPPGDGGSGCSGPEGQAGSLIFNTDFDTMQYCEGSEWIGIGRDPTVSILQQGLIGHWRLDETTGATAFDAMGNFNGNMMGSMDANTNTLSVGAVSSAMNFNGTSNYIDLGTSAGLQPQSLTVSAWIKRNGPWSYSTMIFNTKGSAAYTANGWYFEILDGNKLALVVDGGHMAATGVINFPLESWQHVAATFDTETNAIRIYVNGINVFAPVTGTPDTITPTAQNKYIARNTGGTVIQSSSLDDIRVYNRALTANQILALALENTPIYKWAYVSTGYGYTCGITLSGDAKCWGRNASGTLGNGMTTNVNYPVDVSGGYKWKTISAGYTHSCGVRDNDSAWCWGNNTDGPLGNGTITSSNVPVAVSGGHSWIVVETPGYDNHSCGVTTSNLAYCWGDGYGYSLGESGHTDRLTPNLVPDGYTWTDVDVGFWFGCGVQTTGQGRCWGAGNYGALGYGGGNSRNWPNLVNGGHTWTKIANGDYRHACGIISDGRAKCWGMNDDGQVGDGSTSERQSTTFVSGGHTWVDISPGFYHTCGIRSDGVAMCWGYNGQGQLGDGTATSSSVPVQVVGGHTWKSISAGYYNTCAIRSDDVMMCWGYNNFGQLGNRSSYIASAEPVVVR